MLLYRHDIYSSDDRSFRITLYRFLILATARPFQVQVAAPIGIQDYPFLAIDAYASRGSLLRRLQNPAQSPFISPTGYLVEHVMYQVLVLH